MKRKISSQYNQIFLGGGDVILVLHKISCKIKIPNLKSTISLSLMKRLKCVSLQSGLVITRCYFTSYSKYLFNFIMTDENQKKNQPEPMKIEEINYKLTIAFK